MDPIQQEINMRKSKLLNLVNNLINTQLIDEEISINNDIKTESECLKSLLNVKQTNSMNQMNQINQNNNFNANPFMLQPNLLMNPPIMNINPMIQNNFNSFSNKNINNVQRINVRFSHASGTNILIPFEQNRKISDLINEYRRRTNDFGENIFLFNAKKIDPFSSKTIKELISMDGILRTQAEIFVTPIGQVKE